MMNPKLTCIESWVTLTADMQIAVFLSLILKPCKYKVKYFHNLCEEVIICSPEWKIHAFALLNSHICVMFKKKSQWTVNSKNQHTDSSD